MQASKQKRTDPWLTNEQPSGPGEELMGLWSTPD